MSLPAHHILPASAFRHIGIMVIFMYYMAAFSLLGFLSINDIAKGWMDDLNDTLNIEVSAFDPDEEIVYKPEQVSMNVSIIRNYLENDPLVTSMDVKTADTLKTPMEEMDIPAPAFMTIHLNESRMENAEIRLKDNIRDLVPSVLIHEKEEWEKDIRQTALIFQTIFCGLAISILIVTSIILSAVIRTQLKASDETVKLVHLMGTQIKTIAALFKSSITRAAFWGVFIGGGIAAASLSGLLVILGIEENIREFYIYLGVIALIFIILCRIVTHLTVLSSLRGMP